MTIGEIVLMKPHESPRINKKSIRGDSRDSWPVWNTRIRTMTDEGHLSGLRGQINEKKRTFERQKSGYLSGMENNPFQRITCIHVPVI